MIETYETIVLLQPGLKDEEMDAIIGRLKQVITEKGAVVEKADKWGKRRLSYEIRGHREGVYFLIVSKGPSAAVMEAERTCRVTEDILRYLTTRVEKFKKVPSKLNKKKKKKEPREAVAVAPVSRPQAPSTP